MSQIPDLRFMAEINNHPVADSCLKLEWFNKYRGVQFYEFQL